MKLLIIACSLNPDSRSAVMAQQLAEHAQQIGLPESIDVDLLDLRDHPLPVCDGDAAYGEPAVADLTARSREADAILLSVPVYNYDANAAAKNVVELAGRAWQGKPVGFACAAGGKGSYMSVMGLANSLMLDFRCHIVPRFVYATGDAFHGDGSPDAELDRRLAELVTDTAQLTLGLRWASQPNTTPLKPSLNTEDTRITS